MRCCWCGSEIIYPFVFNPPETIQNKRIDIIKSLLIYPFTSCFFATNNSMSTK